MAPRRGTGWTTSFLLFGVFVWRVPGHGWPLSETTVHEALIYLSRWLSSRLGAVLLHTAGRVQAAFSSSARLEPAALSAHQILQGHCLPHHLLHHHDHHDHDHHDDHHHHHHHHHHTIIIIILRTRNLGVWMTPQNGTPTAHH